MEIWSKRGDFMGFFQGNYGFDFLSIFLLLLGYILNIWPVTRILGLVLLLVVVYRAFSKDINKRKAEYNKFRVVSNKILGKVGLSIPDNLATLDSKNISLLINKIKFEVDQRKKYKTVICPGCHKKLKLNRGRGKVIITCKKCSTEFKAKV
jgi:hypothetical protein